MRHGTSSRRQRNRGNGRRNNSQRTQVYDSNGPDVRIRGTAHQVAEKYLSLAKDAVSAGNNIMAENYYQHAEHYIRIINENNGSFDASKILGTKSAHDMAEDEGNKVDEEADDLSLPASMVAKSSSKSEKEAESVD